MKNDKFEDLVLLVYNYISIYQPEMENPNLHISSLDKFVLANRKILNFVKSGFNLPYGFTHQQSQYNKLIFVVWNMLRGLSYDEAVNRLSDLNIVEIKFYSNIGQSKEECPECDGRGEITCDNCGGEGSIACNNCFESGSVNCDDCGGDGEIDGESCSTCETTGEVTCDECEGSGDISCDWCDGNGENDCDECVDGMVDNEGYTSVTRTLAKLLVDFKSQSKDFLEKIESGNLKNLDEISKNFENTLFYREYRENTSNDNGMLKLSIYEDTVDYENEDFEELNINDGDILSIQIYPYTD